MTRPHGDASEPPYVPKSPFLYRNSDFDHRLLYQPATFFENPMTKTEERQDPKPATVPGEIQPPTVGVRRQGDTVGIAMRDQDNRSNGSEHYLPPRTALRLSRALRRIALEIEPGLAKTKTPMQRAIADAARAHEKRVREIDESFGDVELVRREHAWIPVTQRLPKRGRPVELRSAISDETTTGWFTRDGRCASAPDFDNHVVTHWREKREASQ